MIPIKQDIIPKAKRPGYAMIPEFITIHQTGNTATCANAEMHNRYVHNVGPNPSWHFTVDDKGAFQHLPLNENGWHAGDGVNGTGNRKSIGIEGCVNRDGNLAKAEANMAWLAAKLIKEVKTLKPFPECMRQHWHWTGKDCPAQIRARTGGWDGFLKQVAGFLAEKEERDMLKVAIVINAFADFPAVEPLALRLDAPIFLRGATGQLAAETVIVAGGDAEVFKAPGVKVIALSGADRWLTASNVGEYFRGL